MKDNELLDKMFEGILDCDSHIELTDSNFTTIRSEIIDSLGGLLANAALAVAEQKKLLQSAKTPIGMQTALKLMGVTVGNLLHASSSMLGWMGRVVNKDEFIDTSKDLIKLVDGVRRLVKDGEQNFEVHYQELVDGVNNTILRRIKEEDWVIALGFDVSSGKWRSVSKSFPSFKEALDGLHKNNWR